MTAATHRPRPPAPGAARRRRSLARRILRKIGAVAGILGAILAVLVVGLLVVLDRPSTRRAVVERVNPILASTFRGTLRIERLDHLGVTGVSGVAATMVDDEGVTVLRADGLRAKVSMVDLLRSLLLENGDIRIALPDVALATGEVNLDLRSDGRTRIAAAFDRNGTGGPPGRGVRVTLPRIEVRNVWVHGRPTESVPALDIGVDALHGSLNVDPHVTRVNVEWLTMAARGMPRRADPAGTIDGYVVVPSEPQKTIEIAASFRGAVGGVPATARFSLDGAHLEATVDVPRVGGERLRAMLPEAPIEGALSTHASARGDLPHLDVEALATLGEGSVVAHGDVTLSPALSGSVRAVAARIDARSFGPDAPSSSLGANVEASFAAHTDGTIDGDFHVDMAPGRIAGTPLPRASLRGDYNAGTRGDPPVVTIHGSGKIEEEGAPTVVVLSLGPKGRSTVLAVDAKTSFANLGATRLRAARGAHGALHAMGTLTLPRRDLDVTVDADVDDLAEGPARAAHAHLHGSATGPLGSLAGAVAVDARGLSVGRLEFPEAVVRARGGLGEMTIAASLRGSSRAPDVDAEALVALGEGLRIRGAKVTARRGAVVATLRAGEVRAGGGELRADDVVLEGLGEPLRLSAGKRPTSLEARITAPQIDLARVGLLLGLPETIRGGHAMVDADLAATTRAVRGKLVVDLLHASAFGAKDGVAHVDAAFAGREVVLSVHASEGGLGVVDVRGAKVEIGGNERLDTDSWRRAWGNVDIDTSVDLGRLAMLVRASDAQSFPDLGGNARVRAVISRPSTPGAPPRFAVSLETAGLTYGSAEISHARSGETVVERQGRRIDGLDVQLEASFDGADGALALDGRVLGHDAVLLVVDLNAAAVPWKQIVSAGDPGEVLMRVPLVANVALPRRLVATLPVVGEKGAGEVVATARVGGTVLEPVVDVAVNLYGARSPRIALTSKVDADLAVHHAGGITDATLHASMRNAEALSATAHLEAAVQDFFGATAKTDPPWKATATAKLSRFPIGAIGELSDRQIKGRASGELSAEASPRSASATTRLRIEGLEIGTATFATADVQGSLVDGRLLASTRLERDDAFLDARADVGVAWRPNESPRIDDAKPAIVTLRAKDFPVGALSPFIEPAIADLSGKLDADARLDGAAGGGRTRASGSARLRDATFHVAALGQEFHGVEGKLSLSEDGTLRLDEVRALGRRGLVMASGVAQLRGLRVASARATLRIPKSEPLPIGVQGVQMGDMEGAIDVALASSPDGARTDITVDIPTLHVRLPPSSPHAAQRLDQAKTIRMGMMRAPGELVILPMDGEDLRHKGGPAGTATTVNVAFRLGNDVSVERGKTLRVFLDGNPRVSVAEETGVSGQIRLTRGTLEVQGRRFEIERGTVSFVGEDTSNPVVVVTAGWTAPDGTHVLADFVGPLQTGKLTLRSDPARPQDEIVALILFGTADGSSATPYAQPTTDGVTRAGTASSGLATEGLSRGIDRLTGLDIATKIDTTDSANPRPEIELRIAKDISLQLAFVLGTPPPGTNQDRTFATIDWRFLRNWSLATTFGDQGSSIADVVWRHRY